MGPRSPGCATTPVRRKRYGEPHHVADPSDDPPNRDGDLSQSASSWRPAPSQATRVKPPFPRAEGISRLRDIHRARRRIARCRGWLLTRSALRGSDDRNGDWVWIIGALWLTVIASVIARSVRLRSSPRAHCTRRRIPIRCAGPRVLSKSPQRRRSCPPGKYERAERG